ncbi:hypothetical protein Slin15195_G117330 [Septoria linicola]|uniref:Uncharacterized protein n=1 Tax=Septoria linicola TaxID=215465 RepID=A0A9Q9AZV1_9PEZI|nr:hypothetical protein Slin14017_G094340 [Septoria linicola]USW58414.1 hypothetical protein Slin15195_G117330 [Septoria linicola]
MKGLIFSTLALALTVLPATAQKPGPIKLRKSPHPLDPSLRNTPPPPLPLIHISDIPAQRASAPVPTAASPSATPSQVLSSPAAEPKPTVVSTARLPA